MYNQWNHLLKFLIPMLLITLENNSHSYFVFSFIADINNTCMYLFCREYKCSYCRGVFKSYIISSSFNLLRNLVLERSGAS